MGGLGGGGGDKSICSLTLNLGQNYPVQAVM